MGCTTSRHVDAASIELVPVPRSGDASAKASYTLQEHSESTSPPHPHTAAGETPAHVHCHIEEHKHCSEHQPTNHATGELSPLSAHSQSHATSPHIFMSTGNASVDLDSIDVDRTIGGEGAALLESYAMLKEADGKQWTPRYIQHCSSSINVYSSKANCHEKRLLVTKINLAHDMCDRFMIANTVIGIKVRQPRRAKDKLIEIQFSDANKASVWYQAIVADNRTGLGSSALL